MLLIWRLRHALVEIVELSKIPYVHSVCVITRLGEEVESYISGVYHASTLAKHISMW